jgi:GNAT superfamily N-acetyltransferase
MRGDLAVGWCQLTPRTDLPHFEKTRHLKAVDETPVWSISCFYIRKGHRKKGVTVALIQEALKIGKSWGAKVLEAYPLDAGETTSSSFTGYLSVFERLGFEEVARREKSRPILRYFLLEPGKRTSSKVSARTNSSK